MYRLNKYKIFRGIKISIYISIISLSMLNACSLLDSDEHPIGLVGIVELENQDEHSGVIVWNSELDTFAITDETGLFDFGNVADGSYELRVRYPYFEEKVIKFKVEDGKTTTNKPVRLKQVLRFWIEPAETTISINQDSTNEYILDMRGFVENLTEDTVRIGGTLGPRKLFSLYPTKSSWPLTYDDVDNRIESCYEHYGWHGANIFFDLFVFPIVPGITGSSILRTPNGFILQCLDIGAYYAFWSLSDQRHFKEYFEADYFWDDDHATVELYNYLNRTLQKKKNLLRPSVVHITE